MQKIRIKRARILPMEMVYALQTEDGTYLADGIVHHNCRVCNRTLNGNYEVYLPKLRKELGEEKYWELSRRAHSTQKVTTLEMREKLKEMNLKLTKILEKRKTS